MIRNLIFDFDGTLADTSLGIVRCTQATLAEMGLPASTPERIRSTIGLPLDACFARGTDTPPARIQEACDTYRRLFFDVAVPCMTLFPGVKETLTLLRSHGLQLAIATSRRGASLHLLLDRLGVTEDFVTVAATDNVKHPKPAPDLALLVLEKMGAEAAQSVVIGDTIFDLQMGSAAGCHTCGVTWGNQDREQLQTVSPDWIIDRIQDLPDILF
ncbi:MAG: HAD family hydrolase [Bacteroidales bacterium]|nr:HAD family hydrolase [Bacteroidales bacterium]